MILTTLFRKIPKKSTYLWTFKNHVTKINNLRHYCSSYNLNLSLNNVSLNEYIHNLENIHKTSRNNRIQPVINLLQQRDATINHINNLKELLEDTDEEISKMAKEEKTNLERNIKNVDNELLDAILEVNEEDSNSAALILEVNAGVGGQEAMLFANELFDLYINFIQYKGWEHYIADQTVTDLGGIRHGSVIVNNEDAFRYFKYEAGVHRVQRIPSTEKSSRTHTSTVSVLALPQPMEIRINIQPKDLKIETKRATGAGGQHVNTTDSAVRVVHLPTGLAVECQTDRSQIRNKDTALQRLKAKLYELQMDAQLAETEATKKSQVRSNFRNEKIRTYNFPQDRITDHRLQSANVHNMKAFFLEGEQLEKLILKLNESSKVERLLDAVAEFDKRK